MQILAVGEPHRLEGFLARSPLPGPRARLRTRERGREGYVLVHGSYPSATAARRAIGDLPPSAREQRPRVRRFGSIQAALVPAAD